MDLVPAVPVLVALAVALAAACGGYAAKLMLHATTPIRGDDAGRRDR